MYTVECMCRFRDHWNEHAEFEDRRQALAAAYLLASVRRTRTRVLDAAGRVIWES